MLKPEEITKQLRKFNLLGYSDSSVKYQDNGKNGNILVLTDGAWKYEDEYYGGEPYSGNETLWFDNQDVYRCVYWGKVAAEVKFGDIYDFLRRALKVGPSGSCVHRGPECFVEENLVYTNSCIGTIEEFTQTERIYMNGQEVYLAHFVGGRVNVQKE
jgi:hypothetical protein